ncbi:MAG: CDP-diacylglycerol--glycerol-3-phosphate 3-phosphatidyltransferase [Candidatus Schekmanbacteria bacterium]|nr:CDP-diacylglycerol--glycerol-3-phosphate 3-phosphatidyltransferase [Candidatus Schekmanbacteria bacterium]
MNTPTKLTLARIFVVPVLIVVLLTEVRSDVRTWLDYVGVLLFLAAVATDGLDGYLARRRNQVTTLGILLDPIADKLLTSAALISLVEMERAPAWVVCVIIGREFAVQGLRSIAATRNVVIAAETLGKWKMVAQIVAISLLILNVKVLKAYFIGQLALGVATILAIVSGISYFLSFWSVVSPDLDAIGPVTQQQELE